jgi:hypothetical protein
VSRASRSSSPRPAPSSFDGNWCANRSSSSRVTRGATTASPAATALIAPSNSSGSAFFSKNPDAPAFSPANA